MTTFSSLLDRITLALTAALPIATVMFFAPTV
jgi:hypothetical protein